MFFKLHDEILVSALCEKGRPRYVWNRVATYIWIKVRYDRGLMHLRLNHMFSRTDCEETEIISLVEYRTGITEEETLPLF